jgi:hypothetical protein
MQVESDGQGVWLSQWVWHWPEMQATPVGHGLPQVMQLFGSDCRSTQEPAQHVPTWSESPPSKAHSRGKATFWLSVAGQVDVTQPPAVQEKPPGHEVPPSQLAGAPASSVQRS